MSRIDTGDQAPDFSMPTDTADTISLSTYEGKNVVIYFYPKDDTSGCTKEAIAFTGLVDDFAKADTVIVGVSPDTVKKHAKFRAKHALDVILAEDEDLATCQAYGVWVEKSMYGRSYMGVERSTFLIGKDRKISHVWRKVKVDGHADAVLEAARSL